MFDQITPEHIDSINAIQTAAKIFQETLNKHCPAVTTYDTLAYLVRDAIGHILVPSPTIVRSAAPIEQQVQY